MNAFALSVNNDVLAQVKYKAIRRRLWRGWRRSWVKSTN